MNILVLGGAGYIGSNVVNSLVKESHNVYILDNMSTGYEQLINPKAKFTKGDIRNREDVEKILKNQPIDLVMHFAAKLDVAEGEAFPLEYYSNNVEGVRNVLEVMRDYKVKNILFSSTAAVYGDVSDFPVDESTPCNPVSIYGRSKYMAEQVIESVKDVYGINSCILRYFNVVGCEDTYTYGSLKKNNSALVPTCLKKYFIGEKPTIFGKNYDTRDGTPIRDFIHMDDLVSAHILGGKYIVNENKSVKVNLGTSTGYTVLEVINEINKLITLEFEYGENRPGDIIVSIANNQKAKEILNWEPKKTLKDMIVSEYEFKKKHKVF